MSAILDHPDVDERVDLEQLISWNEQVVCTSRSLHDCTTAATHRATSTVPCPDPIKGVFWCRSRYALHLTLIRQPVNCTYCQRDITVCWRIQPV